MIEIFFINHIIRAFLLSITDSIAVQWLFISLTVELPKMTSINNSLINLLCLIGGGVLLIVIRIAFIILNVLSSDCNEITNFSPQLSGSILSSIYQYSLLTDASRESVVTIA